MHSRATVGANGIRVGTLTFHWGTNYGAVLQAWALQQYLLAQGYSVEIIDYRPARTMMVSTVKRVLRRRYQVLLKELRLARFRREHLITSRNIYRSTRGLRRVSSDYDVYVAGSDQVWNQSFLLHAESRPSLSYYLDFVDSDRRRVSYAASFGADIFPDQVMRLIQPELRRFDRMSVREATGSDIVSELGLSAEVVLDPTLLFKPDAYEELIGSTQGQQSVFSYILHGQEECAMPVIEQALRHYATEQWSRHSESTYASLESWLRAIRDSVCVVTNSFHGAVLAILFHKPFIVLPIAGSGMNNRLVTLLSSVGLPNRLVAAEDEASVDMTLSTAIDWGRVDESLEVLRRKSEAYLLSALKGCD